MRLSPFATMETHWRAQHRSFSPDLLTGYMSINLIIPSIICSQTWTPAIIRFWRSFWKSIFQMRIIEFLYPQPGRRFGPSLSLSRDDISRCGDEIGASRQVCSTARHVGNRGMNGHGAQDHSAVPPSGLSCYKDLLGAFANVD